MERLKSRRSVHISLRVPSELREELQREGSRRKINFNSLGNRILEKYLSFDRLVEHEHSVVIERKVFLGILEEVPVESLAELGKKLGPQVVKESFEFFGIPLTLDNLISNYFTPIGAFSDNYECNATGSTPNLKLILAHEYGDKWSIFLREYASGIIESILGTKPKVLAGVDTVTIEFRG